MAWIASWRGIHYIMDTLSSSWFIVLTEGGGGGEGRGEQWKVKPSGLFPCLKFVVSITLLCEGCLLLGRRVYRYIKKLLQEKKSQKMSFLKLYKWPKNIHALVKISYFLHTKVFTLDDCTASVTQSLKVKVKVKETRTLSALKVFVA